MNNEIQKPAQGDIVGSKDSLKRVMDTPDFKESLKSVAGKYLTAEHVIKAALLAVSRQPKLLQCTKASFLQAAIKAAELGLDFAGQTGQGYLIPFGKECQFIPGYQGFIEIAYRSERVNYIDAQLVYEKDRYEYNLGSNPYINHQPTLTGDRGKVLFGYAIVKLVGSDMPKIELMSYDDIMKIKARSKAKDSGPWKTDEPEMMRKTVLRRAFKYIPKTPEIQTAMEVDNEQFDMNIEELKNDKSNLGANGLKGRLKVKSKDVTREPAPTEEGRKLKQKAKEEIEKLKQADQQKPKTYKCTNEETCGKTLTENQLDITNEGAVCSECGMAVEEIKT